MRRYGRRQLLAYAGRAGVGVVTLGLAACTSDGAPSSAAETGPAEAPGDAATARTPTDGATAGAAAAGAPVAWRRVDLGFVSAYVLARDGRAAVVDTGVEGSAGDIEATLTGLGLGWDAVDHVVLTHRHPDHVGSVEAVAQAATDATLHAGEADIDAITSAVTLAPVADGDEVFGLRIVATPGHTAGHVAVLDPAGGILVAGDALNGTDGGVAGPAPEFTDDLETAHDSVRRLADLSFDVALFGHGPPLEQGADEAVAELARTL